jgi:hypothetical protein
MSTNAAKFNWFTGRCSWGDPRLKSKMRPVLLRGSLPGSQPQNQEHQFFSNTYALHFSTWSLIEQLRQAQSVTLCPAEDIVPTHRFSLHISRKKILTTLSYSVLRESLASLWSLSYTWIESQVNDPALVWNGYASWDRTKSFKGTVSGLGCVVDSCISQCTQITHCHSFSKHHEPFTFHVPTPGLQYFVGGASCPSSLSYPCQWFILKNPKHVDGFLDC